MVVLFNLALATFVYSFVKENNKKYDYQGNPALYGILVILIGLFGTLGFYYGNKEDKVSQKCIGYAVGIFFTMLNILLFI